MARCPAAEAALVPTDAQQLLRPPRIATLAADRRGAPVLVLAVLLLTSLAAALPGGTGRAATDGTGSTGAAYPRVAALGVDAQWAAGFVGQVTRGGTAERAELLDQERAAAGAGLVTGEQSPAGAAFAADGTLIKPFAVDTEVPTISDRVRTYRVRQGDSLTGIAHHFGLQMMTLWWANKLSGKDDLHLGQELIIPPADGILYTVKDGDTLESLARKYETPPEAIVKYNEIEGTTLIIGQQLLLPGGEGAPIRVARERARAASAPARTSTSRSRSGGSSRGGALGWPVPGGHINQYFHYGHYAIDIGAGYGAPVVAAGGGRVIFAGWRNNGGGYQVWISHGGNRYTTYNHMSSLSVGSGASVSRGQQVGRIGSTGWASGPHLHFEVWVGQIWSGGYRVNPLNYL
jgi:murein DD-endopeptidase MepM/ murein hydrolase activator NlpD